MSFKDITLKDISQATSFTRTSIYNYFQTKEEIFLALLQREYDLWRQDLLVLLDTHEAMTADAFAAALAHTLARRARMLKLLSMNHYDMEANSRMENLVAFKRSYGAVYDLLRNLPENLRALLHLDGLIEAVGNVLPLSCIGFGWVCPAIIGLAIGLILHFSRRKKAA